MSEKKRSRTSRKRLVLLLSLLVVAGALSGFLFWIGSGPGYWQLAGGIGKEPQKADNGVPVETVTVARNDLVSSVTSTAALESERSVEVVSKIEGIVQRIGVEERYQEDARYKG